MTKKTGRNYSIPSSNISSTDRPTAAMGKLIKCELAVSYLATEFRVFVS